MKNYNLLEKELQKRLEAVSLSYRAHAGADVDFAGMLNAEMEEFCREKDESGSWWYNDKACDMRDEAIQEIVDLENVLAMEDAMASL